MFCRMQKMKNFPVMKYEKKCLLSSFPLSIVSLSPLLLSFLSSHSWYVLVTQVSGLHSHLFTVSEGNQNRQKREQTILSFAPSSPLSVLCCSHHTGEKTSHVLKVRGDFILLLLLILLADSTEGLFP